MLRRLVYILLLFALAVAAPPLAVAGGTKTLSGKLRSVEGNTLVVKKSGLVRTSEVTVVMTDDTKKTGQIAPGMHVKIKYREEKTAEGEPRLVAIEIAARPEYASKTAKELAKEKKPDPEP